MYKIALEEYDFTNNNGIITVKRHGEDWKDYIGDNAVLALLHKIEELEELNKKLSKSYVESFINYLDMMNTYIPEWKLTAKNEIEQFKILLNKSENGV